MAKNKKPTQLPKYQSWEEVNAALREVGDLNRQIAGIEATLNEGINSLKLDAEAKVVPLALRKTELEENIKMFTEHHKDEFTDSKTKFLTFGKVGFRKSTSLITRNVKAIIEAIKQNRMQDCLSISVTINKEELAKYDDASLEKVGAKRKTEEKFFYEPAIERIEAK